MLSAVPNAEDKQTIIDEQNEQEHLELKENYTIDVSFPGLIDDSVSTAFEKALKEYFNTSPEAFKEAFEKLPSKPKSDPNFLEVKFEDLFKIPVDIKRKNVTIIKMEMANASVDSFSQNLDQSTDLKKNYAASSMITSLGQNLSLKKRSFDNDSMSVAVVQHNSNLDKPTTPNITLNSANTHNRNQEALILSEEIVTLRHNIFSEGASFGQAGGGYYNLAFVTPRADWSINSSLPGQIVLNAPEGNFFTLYTSSGMEHDLGDFEFNLVSPLFTPPLPYKVENGHKIYVEQIYYTLTANDFESSTGTISIEIIDDVPHATIKTNDTYEVLFFVDENETLTGSLILDDGGLGPSSFGADGGFVSDINGVQTIVDNQIVAQTTYGQITVYAHDDLTHAAGDYIYVVDVSQTTPLNDNLIEVTDTISYQITDNDGNVANNTLQVTITLNQPPDAVDDHFTVMPNQILNINAATGVLSNDIISFGDIDFVSEINSSSQNVGQSISLPSGALLTLNEDGSFIYDPNGLSDGQSDAFTYTLEEAEGLISVGNVIIDINAAVPSGRLARTTDVFVPVHNEPFSHFQVVLEEAPLSSVECIPT